MQVQCLDIRGINNEFLKAIAKVKLPELGIVISDIKLFTKNGRYWAALPTKEYMSEGVKKYFPLLQFEDKNKSKDVLDSICAAILSDMKTSSESYKGIAEEGMLPF
jgi:DNA-binding cell septation regulator SpoVG